MNQVEDEKVGRNKERSDDAPAGQSVVIGAKMPELRRRFLVPAYKCSTLRAGSGGFFGNSMKRFEDFVAFLSKDKPGKEPAVPDGKRKRRFSQNSAKREWYAKHRAARFARRLWSVR